MMSNRFMTTVAISFSLLLCGCGMVSGIGMSPVEKLKAAFPIPPETQAALDAVAEMAEIDGTLRDRLDKKIARRTEQCIGKYRPSWYVSVESVRRALNADACFEKVDKGLVKWAGIIQIGVLTAIKSKALNADVAPETITVSDPLMFVYPATAAGVAILNSSKAYELIDLETGKSILRKPLDGSWRALISPNGQVIVRNVGKKLEFTSRQGSVLLTLDAADSNPHLFHWLDHRTAVWSGGGKGTSFFDLENGVELSLEGFGKTQRGFPIPGEPDTYALLRVTKANVTKIKIERDTSMVSVRIVSEHAPISTSQYPSWNGITPISVDGKTIAHFSSDSLKFVNLGESPIDVHTISIAPWTMFQITPAGEPGSFLVYGGASSRENAQMQSWAMVSIPNKTIAKINQEAGYEFAFAPVPGRYLMYGLHTKTISLMKSPPMGEMAPIEDFQERVSKIVAMVNEPYEARERQVRGKANAERFMAFCNTPARQDLCVMIEQKPLKERKSRR